MPKPGKSKGFVLTKAFVTVLKLPYNVAWLVVFTPLYWLMWILVDKILETETFKAKTCPYPKTKDFIKWVKEFRVILIAYYKWPAIANTQPYRCKFCAPGKGTHWCVECNKKMCAQCAYNQHAPGTIASYIHSVEEVVQKRDATGLHILSPLLPFLIIAYAFYVVFFKVGVVLQSDYLTTQVVCPAVNELRSITSQVDANLFLHFKSSFMSWCDVEDTFFRFLADLWVRTIVTNTDDIVLVMQTLPKALLFDVLLINAVVPIVSFIYASLLAVIYFLESCLQRPALKDDGVQPFLLRLEGYSYAINLWGASMVGADWSMTIFPPETKMRARPDLDVLEGYYYRRARMTRFFNYYWSSCLNALNYVMWYIVIFAGVARLTCICFGLAPHIHGLFDMLGLGFIITDARSYFGSDWNLLVNESTIKFSAATLFHFAEIFLGSLPGFVISLWYLWLVLLVVAVIVNGWIVTQLLYQRRASLDAWVADGGSKKTGARYVFSLGDFKQANTLQPRPKAKENGQEAKAKEPTKTPENGAEAKAKEPTKTPENGSEAKAKEPTKTPENGSEAKAKEPTKTPEDGAEAKENRKPRTGNI